MLRNNFGLGIVGGYRNQYNDIELYHGQPYQLKLVNHLFRRALASVYIDGYHQGDFMLEPRDTFFLERPAYERRKFTYFHSDIIGTRTYDQDDNCEDGNCNCCKGIVEVNFVPEKLVKINTKGCPGLKSKSHLRSMRNYSIYDTDIGGTRLSDYSNQVFRPANPVWDDDKAENIYVRLVPRLEDNPPRTYRSSRPFKRLTHQCSWRFEY